DQPIDFATGITNSGIEPKEPSVNMKKTASFIRSQITRSFTAAAKKLAAARIYMDDPDINRSEKELRSIDLLRKEIMMFLSIIETDNHFFDVIQTREVILSDKERAALKDVVIAHFAGKPRTDAIQDLKTAQQSLHDMLVAQNFPIEPILSVAELAELSRELESFLDGDDEDKQDDGPIQTNDEEPGNRHSQSQQEDTPIIPIAVPPAVSTASITMSVPITGGLSGIPPQPVATPRTITPLYRNLVNIASLSDPPVQHGINSIPLIQVADVEKCPCCSQAHKLYDCESRSIQKYCAVNGLCIYCTSDQHRSIECDLASQRNTPAPSTISIRSAAGARFVLNHRDASTSHGIGHMPLEGAALSWRGASRRDRIDKLMNDTYCSAPVSHSKDSPQSESSENEWTEAKDIEYGVNVDSEICVRSLMSKIPRKILQEMRIFYRSGKKPTLRQVIDYFTDALEDLTFPERFNSNYASQAQNAGETHKHPATNKSQKKESGRNPSSWHDSGVANYSFRDNREIHDSQHASIDDLSSMDACLMSSGRKLKDDNTSPLSNEKAGLMSSGHQLFNSNHASRNRLAANDDLSSKEACLMSSGRKPLDDVTSPLYDNSKTRKFTNDRAMPVPEAAGLMSSGRQLKLQSSNSTLNDNAENSVIPVGMNEPRLSGRQPTAHHKVSRTGENSKSSKGFSRREPSRIASSLVNNNSVSSVPGPLIEVNTDDVVNEAKDSTSEAGLMSSGRQPEVLPTHARLMPPGRKHGGVNQAGLMSSGRQPNNNKDHDNIDEAFARLPANRLRPYQARKAKTRIKHYAHVVDSGGPQIPQSVVNLQGPLSL
ncbi:unnamed protein product, partial [Caenorhabditis brenneri]